MVEEKDYGLLLEKLDEVDDVTDKLTDAAISLGTFEKNLLKLGKNFYSRYKKYRIRKKLRPYIPNIDFKALNYLEERQKCLNSGTLFEDPQFPACKESLYYLDPILAKIKWKRPGEIVDNPRFFKDDHSRFDVKQGKLGDCWMLAALANLTLNDDIFYKVVHPDQTFGESYAGIFHFQFWRYGEWVDVVIDDRLPTVDGKLYFMHSEDPSEFWSALLEKAYAKFYGCYENLEEGSQGEALQDFTGGVTDIVEIERARNKDDVMRIMKLAMDRGSLLGSMMLSEDSVKEQRKPNGLVYGHAYSVSGFATFEAMDRSGTQALVRLRNPWGDGVEWNGAFCDGCASWGRISKERRAELEVIHQKDGEFWMCWSDFLNNFTDIEICHHSAQDIYEVSEGALGRGHLQKFSWNEANVSGEWATALRTDGGSDRNPDSWHANPQIRVTVHDVPGSDETPTLILGLLQKYFRENKPQKMDLFPAGLFMFRVSDPNSTLDKEYLRQNKPTFRSSNFFYLREKTFNLSVKPGHYIILPCAPFSGLEGKFLLRIFCNGGIDVKDLTVYKKMSEIAKESVEEIAY